MIRETVLLLAAVVGGTVALGTSLAWLIAACDFPGRRLIGWLLVTPLAIPGYVGGFVWLDTLDGVVGARQARSLWLCAAVMVATLYPYVYLLARAAFAEQGASTFGAARTLGAGPLPTFLRVSLPAARPAIAAGAALVAMEVLTDIGTVRLFNVSTLADGVMRVWFGTGDRGAATEVAGALTGAAILLVVAERLLRRGGRHARGATEAVMRRRPLSALGTVAVLSTCLAVVAVAVVVPVARLVVWARESLGEGTAVTVAGGLGHHLSNTAAIAGVTLALCLAASIVLAVAANRRGPIARRVGQLSGLGYAMPGPVVAVGAVTVLAAVDRWGLLPRGTLLVGSVVGLVFALSSRFLAVGHQGVDASLEKVPAASIASARTLGAGPLRTAITVEIPAARFGILAAAGLLCVDLVKELPITLLLRPFGVDTLSVWVWQATSESLWTQAAVPSLAIVSVGMGAVGALLYAIERGAEVVS